MSLMADSSVVSNDEVVRMKDTTEKEKGEHRIIGSYAPIITDCDDQ